MNHKQTPLYFAGVDIGSTMSKVVIIDEERNLRAAVVGPTGAQHRRKANEVMIEALGQAGIGLDSVGYIVATGYGRLNVPFAEQQVTEITCHARGVITLFPEAQSIIDIGGQDSKAIRIGNRKVIDFTTNDKCAAGTGRFLEVIAENLDLPLSDMSQISLQSSQPVQITSICTIFAQQEVIRYLSEGTALPDVLAGLHDATASRVVRMARRIGILPPVVFTGGVALNPAMVRAMEDNLGYPVLVPSNPLITGALGAAVIARDKYHQLASRGRTPDAEARRLEEVDLFGGGVAK
ncbi:MAG: acyl-CoA dehydratase activase [Bacillota bacterium]